MLAVHALSHGAQAVFVAFVAFVVAAIVAWVVDRSVWATCVGVGLTLVAFVWYAAALS